MSDFVGVLKRHHFWFLTGLVVLLGLVFFLLAQSSLSKETAAQKTAILGIQQSLGQITNTPQHPNPTFVTSIQIEIEDAQKDVRQAWEKLYEQQKNEVFVWPDALGAPFIEHVESLPPNGEIEEKHREFYQNQTENLLRRLGTLADAEWAPQGQEAYPHLDAADPTKWRVSWLNLQKAIDPSSSAYGSSATSTKKKKAKPGSKEEKEEALKVKKLTAKEKAALAKLPKKKKGQATVAELKEKEIEAIPYTIWQWDPTNQMQIMEWFTWPKTPTTLTIRLAQEDLWVLESLCKAIAETNSVASGPYDAPIRNINVMAVGYDAAELLPGGQGTGRIYRPVLPTVGDESGYSGYSGGSSSGEEAGPVKPPRPAGGAVGSGSSSPAGDPYGGGEAVVVTIDQALQMGRYINAQGALIVTAEEAAALSTAEFKLLPFRLKVEMDERQCNSLLIALRNSTLPLQVSEVRINGPETASGSGGYGSSSGSSYGSSSGSSSGSSYGSSGGSSSSGSSSYGSSSSGYSGGGSATDKQDVFKFFYTPIEVRGVAYIVNPPPPEETELAAAGDGSEATGDEVTGDGTAEGEPGADAATEGEAAAGDEGAAEKTSKAKTTVKAKAKAASDAEPAADDMAAEEAAEAPKGKAVKPKPKAGAAADADEPAADEPAADEPAADEPAADEPAGEPAEVEVPAEEEVVE